MKTKITKRDAYAFLLGAFIMIVIQFFSDLNNNIKSFKKGFNEGYQNRTLENTR